MHLKSLVDTPGIFIGYDEENQWLYTDWKGEHDQDSSRQACLLMLNALRGQPCAKILNDNSSISRTTVQLSSWSVMWLEDMLRAGLKHIAWVLPRNFEARQQTEATVVMIQRPVVGTFDDLATAYIWLQQQG